jgi:hypothetical protein
LGHGGGKEDDLGGLRKELEDIVDLLGETTLFELLENSQSADIVGTYRKHLIGLIKDEHLHGVGLQESSLNHVLDTTWGTDNDLRTLLKSLHVITNAGTTNACVALNVHEVTNGDDDLLDLLGQFTRGGENESLALLDVGVKLLEDGDRESGGLSGSRLGLRDNIVAFGRKSVMFQVNLRL